MATTTRSVGVLEVDVKLFRKFAKPSLLVIFTYKKTMICIDGSAIQCVLIYEIKGGKANITFFVKI